LPSSEAPGPTQNCFSAVAITRDPAPKCGPSDTRILAIRVALPLPLPKRFAGLLFLFSAGRPWVDRHQAWYLLCRIMRVVRRLDFLLRTKAMANQTCTVSDLWLDCRGRPPAPWTRARNGGVGGDGSSACCSWPVVGVGSMHPSVTSRSSRVAPLTDWEPIHLGRLPRAAYHFSGTTICFPASSVPSFFTYPARSVAATVSLPPVSEFRGANTSTSRPLGRGGC